MGLLIKNNDATVKPFLNTIDDLDYDKGAIHLRIDIMNENPDVIQEVKEWCNSKAVQFAKIACQVSDLKPSTIKNSYLNNEERCEWIFITSSDVFLKPFTLKTLMAKKLPIVVPMLRPLPIPNDLFRNFFMCVNENGFYKDHPYYNFIAERRITGTFCVECVHSAYLIHKHFASKLNFEGQYPWDFISFSNMARKNKVQQFICNEREFGFYIHCNEEVRHLSLPSLMTSVSKARVQEISRQYLNDDQMLREYQELLPLENYSLYSVESDLFWVDEKWDWIKSNFIKKGLHWETHIVDLFQKYVKRGDTVVDIGGHIGTHTIALSRCVGPEGKVHVFEPQAKLFTELLVNTALNGCENVQPHHVALGSQEGTAFIKSPCLTNEGMAKISSSGEEVSLKTLDSYAISNLSLIKIDIEGYEMEVLKGALATLKQNRPAIIVEIFQGPEQAEKFKFLESLGYEVKQIFEYDYICLPILN